MLLFVLYLMHDERFMPTRVIGPRFLLPHKQVDESYAYASQSLEVHQKYGRFEHVMVETPKKVFGRFHDIISNTAHPATAFEAFFEHALRSTIKL